MNQLIVLSKDIAIAKYINGKLEIVNETLLPLYLKRTENLEKWLEERAIDSHRTNSRLLKRMLRLKEKDDISTVLVVHAATITDNYWVKSFSSNLTYKDIRFKTNIFDEVALNGDSSGFDLPFQRTPELTNIGSYEKCWKVIDGAWYMYKKEPLESLFSEIFISKLGQLLGFKMVDYNRRGDNLIYCKDFTNGAAVNFEDAYGLMNEDKEIDFIYNFDIFYNINPQIAHDYANMLYLDAICMNIDRHIHNYGILRDVDTGSVLQLAPNFDNNISLLYNGKHTEPVMGFMKDYVEFFIAKKELFSFPGLLLNQVEQAIAKTAEQFTSEEMQILNSKMNIVKFVINSHEYIAKELIKYSAI